MYVSPINRSTNFGNSKNFIRNKAKKLIVPLLSLSTLVIASGCEGYSRKPYQECTKAEADSLYRKKHALDYAEYAIHPNWYFEDDLRKRVENCLCSSCDSMKNEFAKKDSIANAEKIKAEQKRIAAQKRAKFLKTYHNDLLETTLKRTINSINSHRYSGIISEEDLKKLEYVDENKCVIKDDYGNIKTELKLIEGINGKYAFIVNRKDKDFKTVFAFNKDNSYMDYPDAANFTAKIKNATIGNPISEGLKSSFHELCKGVGTAYNHKFNIDIKYNNFRIVDKESTNFFGGEIYDELEQNEKLNWQKNGKDAYIKMEVDKDGDYTLYYLRRYAKGFFKDGYEDKIVKMLQFTKDHKLKNDSYMEEAIGTPTTVQIEKANKQGAADLAEIKMFEDVDVKALQKLAAGIGVRDVEYVSKGSGVYNLLMKKDGYQYDILAKKTSEDGTFAGIAKRLLDNGSSEIYIFQTEHFSTNKSDKLRISKMRVVQDGLTDDSPTQKKFDRETTKTGRNSSTTTHDVDVKARKNMLFPMIPNFIEPGRNYSGSVVSKTIDDINEIILEGNAEGRIVTVYSCPKNSNVVEMNGQVVR